MNEALPQMQAMYATIPMKRQQPAALNSATSKLPNDTKIEPMTASARDMGVDPISVVTTMGIVDTLPTYQADDNGLLEGDPCTSDTKDEQPYPPLHQRRRRGYPQLQNLAL